jgi:hypoxanthine phosphoribosyltransferase
LLVLGLLKGSFIFLSDLVRQIDRPLHLDFLVASSYGTGTVSSGTVRLLYDPETPLEGKHIVIVEDIIDSGRTMLKLLGLLQARNPASVAVCSLLDKKLLPTPIPVAVGRIHGTPGVPRGLRPRPRRRFSPPPVHR